MAETATRARALLMFSVLQRYSTYIAFDPYWTSYIQILIHLLSWILSFQINSFNTLLRAGQGLLKQTKTEVGPG